MRTALPLLALLLSGCTTDEASFEESYARELCKALKKCEEVYFDTIYADTDACEADIAGQFDHSSCTYSPDDGHDCLRALKQSNCDAFVMGTWAVACDNVWTCDG